MFQFEYSPENLTKRSKAFGRLSLIALLLLLITISVNAQQGDNSLTGWDIRSPQSTAKFYDIVALNSSSAAVVGAGGAYFQTKDNGKTWNSQSVGTSNDLFAIAHNANFTIIAGTKGTLLLNTSTGWKNISPTSVDLYAIDIPVVNATNTIIFIGGESGKLWKSTNGGANWTNLQSSTTERINDISFYNATYGLAVGNNGLVIGTLNGRDFQPRDIPTSITTNLNGVEFYSSIRAFIVGDNGVFLRSDISDTLYSGFSWQQWQTGTTADLTGLDATSTNKIFISGTNSTVLLTKDGGNSFSNQKTGTSSTDFNAISMSNGFFGFVAGDQGTVLFTDRQGVSANEIPTVKNFNDFSVYWHEAFPLIMKGFVNMLKIIFLSMLFGFILGITIAVGKTVEFQPLRLLATIYTDFFRNTPLLVQIFVIHFGFPELNIDLTLGGFIADRAFASSLIALSLNSGAYQAEIIRSGIQAIPTGQMEAGRSVGLTYGQTMRYVILPQAIRVVIPPLGNEFVNLTLNSSLASVTGYFELTRAGRLIIAISFLNFQTWILIALFYFVITYTLTNILRYAEKKSRIPGLGLGRS